MKQLLRGAVLLLLVAGIGCRPAEPRPFHPRTLQEIERQGAGQHPERPPMRPLPRTFHSPYPDEPDAVNQRQPVGEEAAPAEAQTIRLSLQEIVQRAMAHSQDVRVSGYGPAVEQTRVIEAEALFDPVFFTNLGFERRDVRTAGTPFPSPIIPGQTILIDEERTDAYTLQSGIRQLLASGGEVEVSYQVQRTSLSPQRFEIDPAYENELVLQMTQPLLRNFGREINRARIGIARNDQRISLLNFRQAVEQTVSEVEEVYWQLVLAEWDIQIQEHLLADTEHTVQILRDRLGLDVTRLQVSQAQATLETRRAALIRTRARVRDLSDQLKRLMNDPSLPVAGPTVIYPATGPIEEPLRLDLADQIETAMEYRPELAQQQLRVNSATIASRAARNNLWPQLNLVGSIGLQGLGDGLGDAFDVQSDLDHISYAIGLQLEVPIGNRAARSVWRRSQLQRQAAIEQYRGLIDQVALEVKVAMNDVVTSWEEMRATRQARFAAEDALEAIQQREEADEPLTPTFVQLKLDRQAELANAQRAEITAAVNYNRAIAALERSKGTLLPYNNIIMEERPVPWAAW